MRNKEEEKISILIVDDNKEACMATSSMLDDVTDFEIIGTISNGNDLGNFLTKQQPDIILMDVSMQPMDGAEATRFVLKNYPSIQVIAFSVHRNKNYIEKMKSAGAKDYILKSAPLKAIIGSIRRISRKKAA